MSRILRLLRHLAREWWTALAASLPNDLLSTRLRAAMFQAAGIQIDRPAYIYRHVLLLGRISIGKGSSISNNTCMNGAQAGISIGRNVMIAPGCCIVAFDHDTTPGPLPMIQRPWLESPVVIEDNVWIAANCTITRGVRIGAGAVVAANSVVTTDVPPDAIVGGSPARVLRFRH